MRKIRDARGWLVTIDREICSDIAFSKHLCRDARWAYLDSMFHAALTGGPGSVYPHAWLAQDVGDRDAHALAEQLLAGGYWERVALGYVPQPFALCWLRPDRRMAFSADLRARVYSRDGHRCVRCGTTERLTLDHIYPWSKGGSDDESNLQTMCLTCNISKGARV